MLHYTTLNKLSRVELATLLNSLNEQLDMDTKRLVLLQKTATNKPEWKGYNPMIDNYVTIDCYIEQFQAITEESHYDIALIQTIINKLDGFNQTIKMF